MLSTAHAEAEQRGRGLSSSREKFLRGGQPARTRSSRASRPNRETAQEERDCGCADRKVPTAAPEYPLRHLLRARVMHKGEHNGWPYDVASELRADRLRRLLG